MSSLVSDSGASASVEISSRVAAVVATSAAAVATTAFTGSSNQSHTHGPGKELDVSSLSPLRSSEITGGNLHCNANSTECDENIHVTSNGNCHSLPLMQSSPPPHSYRHSRAYRHFKNPPQPHMCIRTTTETGEELFINVLSWTRIVIPQEPTDPIPLYGGMRVPPGNPRSPPIVFAVMANPEVLKDSGRHSKDPEERRAMVELMCDFVEAMNPGVKLVRNAIILKDRDISGELKDVWNAVQAQRDREREEQMMLQRQQQHFHSVTTQQMFPKSAEGGRIAEQKQGSIATNISLEKVERMSPEYSTERNLELRNDAAHSDSKNTNLNRELPLPGVETRSLNVNHPKENDLCGKLPIKETKPSGEEALSITIDGKDQIDANHKLSIKSASIYNTETVGKTVVCSSLPSGEESSVQATKQQGSQIGDNHSRSLPMATVATGVPVATVTSSKLSIPANLAQIPTSVATAASTPVSTKKDKLVGFLPNGCIFPRFKNNKNKEKDKDKEKEAKTKDKEKTLLNALKKSKDKKVAPIEQSEKTSPETDPKLNYEKNCINLENEVQKLDLNKIETGAGGENMFIKLKMAATSATAK